MGFPMRSPGALVSQTFQKEGHWKWTKESTSNRDQPVLVHHEKGFGQDSEVKTCEIQLALSRSQQLLIGPSSNFASALRIHQVILTVFFINKIL